MDPLEQFANFIVFSLLKFTDGERAGEVLAYFIYDAIKVILLLAIMVFLVSIIRTFITKNKIKKFLGNKKEGIGNILAALLGIPTPFCSCSAVPIFMGFLQAGVPLGITFSFLISSPLINEVAIALLFALFGWQVAALYIITGLFISIFAGIIIGRLKLEKEVEKFALKSHLQNSRDEKMSWKKRFEFAKEQSFHITSKVAPYIIAGVAIGALIHGFAPTGFLAQIAGKDNPFAVVIAVLIGIPLYSNAAGTIPIVQALMGKGMAIGTALAFMMSVTALSFPEMVILRKVLKPKLIAIFVIVLAISFILTGLLFNAILG